MKRKKFEDSCTESLKRANALSFEIASNVCIQVTGERTSSVIGAIAGVVLHKILTVDRDSETTELLKTEDRAHIEDRACMCLGMIASEVNKRRLGNNAMIGPIQALLGAFLSSESKAPSNEVPVQPEHSGKVAHLVIIH